MDGDDVGSLEGQVEAADAVLGTGRVDEEDGVAPSPVTPAPRWDRVRFDRDLGVGDDAAAAAGVQGCRVLDQERALVLDRKVTGSRVQVCGNRQTYHQADHSHQKSETRHVARILLHVFFISLAVKDNALLQVCRRDGKDDADDLLISETESDQVTMLSGRTWSAGHRPRVYEKKKHEDNEMVAGQMSFSVEGSCLAFTGTVGKSKSKL